MRILLAIVHHWNPEGGGKHASLRPNPSSRLEAFQAQLLSLQRLGYRQSQLNIAELEAQSVNQDLRHEIHIAVITDGEHHLIDRLDPSYQGLYSLVLTKPPTARHLGFEAQRFLSSRISDGFDLFGYMEDDLVIHDPYFFRKIDCFRKENGDECLLLPNRMELVSKPHPVDKFYIDGPVRKEDGIKLISHPCSEINSEWLGRQITFETPLNPHSGCFFLSRAQLLHWTQQPHWQDGDSSWISPLESAATLGIAKTFRIFKPSMKHASWLELQHWGNSFHCLLGRTVSLPSDQEREVDLEEKNDSDS